ncbi:hypothetical protein [Peribacillus glennii]|uniref:Uncharacterized protein n=1 Tax=Peribacillus glennii TaxID=2303991 RepID=A0A372L7Y6_9BACI|nr:hypothetical protein [Peribacillus glennii]RFU61442.1 hypothetical protein D0466_18340 [Peribacillus glennii]
MIRVMNINNAVIILLQNSIIVTSIKLSPATILVSTILIHQVAAAVHVATIIIIPPTTILASTNIYTHQVADAGKVITPDLTKDVSVDIIAPATLMGILLEARVMSHLKFHHSTSV